MTRKLSILLTILISQITLAAGQSVTVEILHQTTGNPICDVEVVVKDFTRNRVERKFNSDDEGKFLIPTRYFEGNFKATLIQNQDIILKNFNLSTFQASKGERQIKVGSPKARTCDRKLESNNSSKELEKMRSDLESMKRKNDDTLELLGKIFEDTHSQIDKQIQENFQKLSDLEQKVPILEQDIEILRIDSAMQQNNYNILKKGAEQERKELVKEKNQLEQDKNDLIAEITSLKEKIEEILINLSIELPYSIPVLKEFSFLTLTKNNLPTKKITQWHTVELRANFFEPRNLDRKLSSYSATMTIDMGFNKTRSYPLYFNTAGSFIKNTNADEEGLGIYYLDIGHVDRYYLKQCESIKIEFFYASKLRDKQDLIGTCVQNVEGKMESRRLAKECRCWKEKY